MENKKFIHPRDKSSLQTVSSLFTDISNLENGGWKGSEGNEGKGEN